MDILYLDGGIVVVNKPAEVPVLADGWAQGMPYLVQMLEAELAAQGDEEDQHVWTVHRLDKTTSGVMVFARTAEAHRALNSQFEQHEAKKIYHAILTGIPDWQEKTAKHPL